jgi:hypothetical protein
VLTTRQASRASYDQGRVTQTHLAGERALH